MMAACVLLLHKKTYRSTDIAIVTDGPKERFEEERKRAAQQRRICQLNETLSQLESKLASQRLAQRERRIRLRDKVEAGSAGTAVPVVSVAVNETAPAATMNATSATPVDGA